MSALDPQRPRLGHWPIEGDWARCPDCSDLMPGVAISEHVDWHIALRSVLASAGVFLDGFVERFADGSGELAEMAHDYQVTRLRQLGS